MSQGETHSFEFNVSAQARKKNKKNLSNPKLYYILYPFHEFTGTGGQRREPWRKTRVKLGNLTIIRNWCQNVILTVQAK